MAEVEEALMKARRMAVRDLCELIPLMSAKPTFTQFWPTNPIARDAWTLLSLVIQDLGPPPDIGNDKTIP
ncbi:hypothetical protein TNCT_389471 [Trichonephila clavata]|uniref:Uncharacterized protein n=1 Tax=Trichonephila clavata TaxID=2740835 RepID=A0A8X6F9I4_TRICU|nr:hypothetical protein TNCT_389471 [Trichonephila clavata]